MRRVVVLDSDDPAAVVRLVLEQQEAGAPARIQGNGHAENCLAGCRRQGGARIWSRRSPRRGLRCRARTARSCASIPRPEPPPGESRPPNGFRRPPARMRRSSPSVRTRATCSPSPRTASRCGRSKVTSEVVSPPKVAEGIVVVWSGDGRVFGVSAADGKTKWVYQRNNPPLTVRNFAAASSRAAASSWARPAASCWPSISARATSAGKRTSPRPRARRSSSGSSTSRRCRSSTDSQACAVAYQGRVACFDIVRGTLNWSRDVSSLEGLVMDARYLYVTDDKGAIQALDKTTGASAWKQDKLAQRRPSGPQMIGDYRRRGRWRRLRSSARYQRRQPRGTRRDRRHGAHGAAVEVRRQPRSGKARAGCCFRSASANRPRTVRRGLEPAGPPLPDSIPIAAHPVA